MARFTLDRAPIPEEDDPPCPTLSHTSRRQQRRSFRTHHSGIPTRPRPTAGHAPCTADGFGGRHVIPKMSCPTFDGSNPRIQKSKCLDYFQLCNIDEAFWPIAASLNMDGNAAKWLEVYKKKYGLGDWDSFIAAMGKIFGANDYRDAMGDLLDLK